MSVELIIGFLLTLLVGFILGKFCTKQILVVESHSHFHPQDPGEDEMMVIDDELENELLAEEDEDEMFDEDDDEQVSRK